MGRLPLSRADSYFFVHRTRTPTVDWYVRRDERTPGYRPLTAAALHTRPAATPTHPHNSPHYLPDFISTYPYLSPMFLDNDLCAGAMISR